MLKKTNDGIRYQRLTEEEKKRRGILGRLVGPCADFINPTRNGRKYSEQLWENVFNNPLMQEKIKNRVCYGELGHPENRSTIDPEKIAVCLSEVPVKNSKGQLEAVFDILDTPNGRILKALCDYGSTVGVSSRGQGDIITDYNGDEAVDPDTYECECWDIVLIPAVETARLTYVTESLDTKNLKKQEDIELKEALTQIYESADEKGKKVINETLEDLHIKLDEGRASSDEDYVELDIKDALYYIKSMGYFDFMDGPETEYKVQEVLKRFPEYINNKSYRHSPAYGKELEVVKLPNGETRIKVKDLEIKEAVEDDEKVEEPIVDEIPVDIPEEPLTDEIPVENELPVDELNLDEPVEGEEITDLVVEPELGEPVEGEEVEVEEDTRTDEEIFLDYLVANFDEKQIKKACKALDIEVPEKEEDEESESEEDVEAEEAEDEKKDDAEAEDAEDKEDTKEDEEENSTEGDEPAEEDKEAEDDNEVDEALDEGSLQVIKNLQEALKTKMELETANKLLKEDLAVSDAKVNELTEECSRYKKAITRLATVAKSKKDLDENVSKLQESLQDKEKIIEQQNLRISRLVQTRKSALTESKSLNEAVESKNKELDKLNESVESIKTQYLNKFKDLKEEVTREEENFKKEKLGLQEDLKKEVVLKESYKKLANDAMNLLIEERAKQLGVKPNDIKRKLGASYTISDVNSVCEDLKRYQLNVSKLPFSVDRKVGIRVNEAKNNSPISRQANRYAEDDAVDESLLRLANLM